MPFYSYSVAFLAHVYWVPVQEKWGNWNFPRTFTCFSVFLFWINFLLCLIIQLFLLSRFQTNLHVWWRYDKKNHIFRLFSFWMLTAVFRLNQSDVFRSLSRSETLNLRPLFPTECTKWPEVAKSYIFGTIPQVESVILLFENAIPFLSFIIFSIVVHGFDGAVPSKWIDEENQRKRKRYSH